MAWKTWIGGALLSPAIVMGWRRWKSARDAGNGLAGGETNPQRTPTSAAPGPTGLTGAAPQQGTQPAPQPTTPPTAGG